MCVSVGMGRRSVRPIIGTVTRPRWQHCSGAFCAVPYRPSLDESFFPHLAAVQADRSLQGRAALAIAATESAYLLSTRTAATSNPSQRKTPQQPGQTPDSTSSTALQRLILP